MDNKQRLAGKLVFLFLKIRAFFAKFDAICIIFTELIVVEGARLMREYRDRRDLADAQRRGGSPPAVR
ncbi:hypothetical protein C1N70_20460 [Cytobacillus firmus]